MVDTLHTVDLGVASHIVGNVFWLYAVSRRVFGPGGTQEMAIQALNRHMKEWYKTTRATVTSRLQGNLSADRVRTSGGWPKLKAKAAATRHLASYALFLVQTFGTDEDREVLAVCQLLCRFYQILSDEPMFLSASAKTEIARVGFRLANIYSVLSRRALDARIKMWKLTPKLHLFVHLCE